MCHKLCISNGANFCLTLSVFKVFIDVSTSGKDIYLAEQVGTPLAYLLKVLKRYRVRPCRITVVINIKKNPNA